MEYIKRIKDDHKILAFENGNRSTGERLICKDEDSDAQRQHEKELELEKNTQNTLQKQIGFPKEKIDVLFTLFELIARIEADELSEKPEFALPEAEINAYEFFFKNAKPNSGITTLKNNMENVHASCRDIVNKLRKNTDEQEKSLDILEKFKRLFDLKFFSDFYFLNECFNLSKNEISFFDFHCGRPEAMLIVWDTALVDEQYYDIDKNFQTSRKTRKNLRTAFPTQKMSFCRVRRQCPATPRMEAATNG
ncbi:MAG: hypothetical protein LBI69_02920 [Puniceicoccales bacterium]|jgi:hypothetical protein|nr:hypothetical protein [Puniceicoccales bacterium]